MPSILAKIALSIMLIVCLSAQSQPPIWGGSLQYSVNVSFIYDNPVMKWNFTYYYDWNVKS